MQMQKQNTEILYERERIQDCCYPFKEKQKQNAKIKRTKNKIKDNRKQKKIKTKKKHLNNDCIRYHNFM